MQLLFVRIGASLSLTMRTTNRCDRRRNYAYLCRDLLRPDNDVTTVTHVLRKKMCGWRLKCKDRIIQDHTNKPTGKRRLENSRLENSGVKNDGCDTVCHNLSL